MYYLNKIWTFLVEVWAQIGAAANPAESMAIIFFNGGWILFLWMSWHYFKVGWLEYRQNLYHEKNRHFILLAIDVPRDNEQSPRAVENLFAHLHGIIPGRNTLYQTWWLGKTNDMFSLELVSIDGYVQFLVYTQVEYRDLVESAFYAQYPDAEITEVEDYVQGTNNEFKGLRFPHEKYDLFGTEYVLRRGDAYPIRLYREFEHALSQEFKDPMASLLENMTKIGPGEQIWIQLVITPQFDFLWQPKAQKEALRIAGKGEKEEPGNWFDHALGGALNWLDALAVVLFPLYQETELTPVKEEPVSLMLHLTPAEKAQVEGIQMKIDKPGFSTKFRFLYIAEKSVFSKARGMSPVRGSFQQFSANNLNSLTLHRWTKTTGLDYWMVKWRLARRQNNLIIAYQNRSRSRGSSGIILNTEELATLYHFPMITVKAPLVSRTQAKRASAPISLPLEGPLTPWPFRPPRPSATTGAPPAALPAAAATPDNLPFV